MNQRPNLPRPVFLLAAAGLIGWAVLLALLVRLRARFFPRSAPCSEPLFVWLRLSTGGRARVARGDTIIFPPGVYAEIDPDQSDRGCTPCSLKETP